MCQNFSFQVCFLSDSQGQKIVYFGLLKYVNVQLELWFLTVLILPLIGPCFAWAANASYAFKINIIVILA